ncbi:MAG: beta-hydroxyacyl-ACP dehydratase [Phycisphaerales bacterium]|nr:beta-hydroxyacyl-ACP dehydratase [Phycisphaerales bacterium]
MASQLLFPIDQIDRTKTLCDKAEIDRYLPQTGHMRMIDRVLWLSQDGTWAFGERLVRPDEFWCEGHIPGRPIFPGVLMIEAAAQLCSIAHTRLGRAKGFLGFIRCDDVVFRGQVVPGDTFFVLTRELSYNPRRFVSRTQGVVNDKLVFEATITGMVI